MSMAWLITRRELREILRDYNLLLPIFFLPILMGLLAGFVAYGSAMGQSSIVGLAAGAIVVQQLPLPAIRQVTSASGIPQENVVALLLKAVSIPFFWVVPVALTSSVAADSFVGEKERDTLEPLLATPLQNRELLAGKLLTAIIPAILGTWLGIALFAAFVAASRSPYYPRFILSDGDWAFSTLVIIPLMAIFAAGIAALISTRVASFRAAYQLNGLIALPIILLLIPQTVVLFLWTADALVYVAGGLAMLDVLIVLWALGTFDRERLLRGA